MSHALAMPNEKDPSEAHILNPDVSEDVLESFYGKWRSTYYNSSSPVFPESAL